MKIEWNIDPELATLFGIFPIRYYSICFVLGLLLGIAFVKRIWIKENLSIDNFEKLTTYVFFATIIGARLGHCLFYEPSYYLAHPLEIVLPFRIENGGFTFTGFQGLASHGGILAVFLTVLVFSIRSRISFLSIADKVCIGGAITAIFIRLGNFMNSEIIGKPTNSDFGVIFRRVDHLARHPSQLYEAIAYFFIFLTIFYVYRKSKTRQDGFILGLFFTLLFTARFLIEFTKINQVDFEDHMVLNMGQVLSIPFIILGILLMILKSKNRQKNLAYS